MKLLSPIDLKKELIQEKLRQERLMDSVHGILDHAASRDRDVLQRLNGDVSEGELEKKSWDPDRVYTLSQIRAICVRYRLRFLDSRHFKAEYPYEAIAEIHSFEKRYGIQIRNFRIIAPDRMFDLENINKDPLLFAELPDGRFYFLHKWGNDLRWQRRILTWPLQSFRNYFISQWIVCFLGSFLLPSSLLHVFNAESEFYLRVWFMIHLFIGLSGVSLWLAFSYDKRFSDMQWDSKHYNF